MYAVLPATAVATTSRPSTDFSMLVTVRTSTIRRERDHQGCDQADPQGDRPVGAAGDEQRHLPTATFRSARAECRMRTPESLIRAIPGSSAV